MAHFAKVENGVVTAVLVIPDEEEHQGEAYLNALGLFGRWIQTSYNTYAGSHPEGVPLRKNYAGIGFAYDETRDAFIPPQPFSSWTVDDETCLWQPPVPYPDDGENYEWDEENQVWVLFEGDA